jgi:hypothetical protein
MNKRVFKKPAPAEANSLRRADFVVPILGTWLPLTLYAEAARKTETWHNLMNTVGNVKMTLKLNGKLS